MPMSEDERKSLDNDLRKSSLTFGFGCRMWSAAFNWSLALSAVLSALAAALLVSPIVQGALGISNDSLKGVAALMSATATLVTTISAGNGFGRKWQANRVSRGRIERLQIVFRAPDADATMVRTELCDTLAKHDQAIIGAPVK